MRTLLYIVFFCGIIGVVSCSKSDSEQKDTHKLSDEIILDSISVDQFKSLLDKAVSDNDTSDIQKLLGLAQSTYQRISLLNDAEAENYAQQIKDIISNEPYLDNLIANKNNFFFKFNNADFLEEQPETDNENNVQSDQEVMQERDIETDLPDNITEEQTTVHNATEKKPDEVKKGDDKKTTTPSSTSQPKERVKSSFDKPADK